MIDRNVARISAHQHSGEPARLLEFGELFFASRWLFQSPVGMELVLDCVGLRVCPYSAGTNNESCGAEEALERRERSVRSLIEFNGEYRTFEQILFTRVPSCFRLERGNRRTKIYWLGVFCRAAGFIHGRFDQGFQPILERDARLV